MRNKLLNKKPPALRLLQQSARGFKTQMIMTNLSQNCFIAIINSKNEVTTVAVNPICHAAGIIEKPNLLNFKKPHALGKTIGHCSTLYLMSK